ncbi:hypothetical protein [Alicyclobacillus sacchari]|nr:hypothetical protein [Alicyclobacillus sacchari]
MQASPLANGVFWRRNADALADPLLARMLQSLHAHFSLDAAPK